MTNQDVKIEAARQVFARYIELDAAKSSPLYTHLIARIIEDEPILALSAHVQHGQPPPNMLLAAVQVLLIEDEDAKLRAFYPQFCDMPRPVEEAYPVFRAYCLENAERLIPLIATRRTQTNEIGRSQFIYLAMSTLSIDQPTVDQPISIIEVGCSAGLNLNWHRYAYDFGDLGQRGVSDSPVQLTTTWVGDIRPKLSPEPPVVAHSVGIDLNPLDVTNPEDARWLESLLWPEHHDRRARSRAAIAVANQYAPDLRRGNLFDLLPEAVEDAPSDTFVAVVSTFVLYQLSAEKREKFKSLLDELAQEREVGWISADWLEHKTARLTLTTWPNGQRETRHLANIHAHARWIEWRA